MNIKMQGAYRTPNIMEQKRKSPQHITIKALTIQIKGKSLNSARGKCDLLKADLLELHLTFQWRL